MRRGAGAERLLALALLLFPILSSAQSLTILDVPFIAQSELLCGGAAAAMVMRYWGARGIDAESFAALSDPRAGGIRTTALVDDLHARQWNAVGLEGSSAMLDAELRNGRPVITLIEDHPGTYHYVVVVGRNEAGVVFHDPARTPFRVASAAEFDRRWSSTDRWMLIVTPGPSGPDGSAPRTEGGAEPVGPRSSCDAQISEAIAEAGRSELDGAERTLVGALSCPGSAVFRELAGVRIRQQRWAEAEDLAATAVSRDPSDTYAWKLLATARFVDDDKAGALDAWNEAQEPRLDLVRLDGLTRTRFGVVQHLIGLKPGETLTSARLLRARRQLNDLPAGAGSLDYEPQPSGLAEVHGVVIERPLVPSGALDLGVLALATAVTGEAVASVSSPTGGGERIAVDWRFWPHRPLYQVSFAAPAPWSGVWAVTASREEQPFTTQFPKSLHDTVRVDAGAWVTGHVRWQVTTGADRWNGGPAHGNVGAAVRLASGGDRVDLRGQARSWIGGGDTFQSGDVQLLARSSVAPQGIVFIVEGGVSAIGRAAPPDLWFAGDTGRARPLLLRAHPILAEDARFRSDRLARLFGHETTEMQRWWHAGPFRIGGAAFADTARTSWRTSGDALTDVDTGVGFRCAIPGNAGMLRGDFARGLRDGNTAFSVVYTEGLGR